MINLCFILNIANSADPDEMPPYAAFHLGLHCLYQYLESKWLGKSLVNVCNYVICYC